jgi:hypothetical protein
VTDKQVLELSSLTGLTTLNLSWCQHVTSEVLQAVSSLTALTSSWCDQGNLTDEGWRH